jgi:hypothetical protein
MVHHNKALNVMLLYSFPYKDDDFRDFLFIPLHSFLAFQVHPTLSFQLSLNFCHAPRQMQRPLAGLH